MTQNNQEKCICWSLSGEAMGFLERAGLAGLYMTLTSLDYWIKNGDENAEQLSNHLQWSLTDQSISLKWKGDDYQALSPLVNWSWQIIDDIYFLPGIHRTIDAKEHKYLRINTHSGLLNTFLQFTGKLTPKAVEKRVNEIITFDQTRPNDSIKITYRPFEKGQIIRQLQQLTNTCPIFDKKYILKKVEIPGWLYPGSAKRFSKYESQWEGTSDIAFLLFFSPIASIFVKLPNTKSKKKLRENWAFIIPEITSLEAFQDNFMFIQNEIQTRFDNVDVQGIGDAGLKYATAYAGRAIQKKNPLNPNIYVVTMGVTNYYSSNPIINPSVRKGIFTIKSSDFSIKRYGIVQKTLQNRFLPSNQNDDDEKKATHYIKQPTSRGRITDNLINNDDWYRDIYLVPPWQHDSLDEECQWIRKKGETISIETLWFKKLHDYERRELMSIIENESMWKDQQDKIFIEIFHQTLRSILNQEEEAIKRGGSRKLHERWDDKIEEIRRSLIHAKTLPLFREFFSKLLAKGGGFMKLTENKKYVWDIINDQIRWQKARDLAYLGLVTFTDGRLGKTDPNEKQTLNEGGK